MSASSHTFEPPNTHDSSDSSIGIVIYAAVLGIVVALIAGYYELAFRSLADFWHTHNPLANHLPNWGITLLGLLLACPLMYWLISRIPEKRQHNPADIITGIHIHNGKINAEACILTAIGSILSLGAGFSVGFYAPIVQLGAGVGFLFHHIRYIRPNYYYISIGAGTAAAIAAIFHSPIAAVVFVHEVLFRFFSVRAFAPVTISAVSSYVVSSQLFDKAVFFETSPHYAADMPTYLIAAAIGVLAAFIGIIVIRLVMLLQKTAKQRQLGILQQFILTAIFSAPLIIFFPALMGNEVITLDNLIGSHYFSIKILCLLLIGKILATVIALGLGIPGGIFGPSVFIGATLGSLIVGIIQWYFPLVVIEQQILVISTLAAMISSILGAPIAMILIAVEITGDLEIISVVMIAVVMANITSFRFLGTSSYFDIQLKSRGFNFDRGRDRLYAESHGIMDIISNDYLSLSLETPLADAQSQLLAAEQNIAYVIDEDGNLLGKVTLVDVQFYRSQMPDDDQLSAILQKNPTTVYQNASIWQALQIATQTKSQYMPVIDGENNPKLLGVVYSKDLISGYFRYMQALRAQENVIAPKPNK